MTKDIEKARRLGFSEFTETKKSKTKGPISMRLKKHDIHQRINSNLQIEFVQQDITSYSGLELFKRYFRYIDLNTRIRRAFRGHSFKGDYSILDFIMVFISLWLTGANRLQHVGYLAEDPLVKRLCGLKSIPSDRSLSNWLKQFTNDSLQALVTLNSEIVMEKIQELDLARITLDFDGTALSCGNKVAWAFRGYNPHKRYAKSYYPLLCHIAQTGHFLQVRNRPGNVHDSKGGALSVIKSSIGQVRQFLPGVKVEARFDAAFFTQDIVKYLQRKKIGFAVRVPLWPFLNLKEMIMARKRWSHASRNLAWFRSKIYIKKWEQELELLFFRKKISGKKKKKQFQLDLFSPDDGIYEYTVIFSTMQLKPKNIWEFYHGRCAMEQQISELKGEFGFATVPTWHYQGNSAHQNLSVMTYNLVRNFQIDTELAQPRKPSPKRTGIFSFKSLKTLRFEWIAVAGLIVKSCRGKILRLTRSMARKKKYSQIMDGLDEMNKAA